MKLSQLVEKAQHFHAEAVRILSRAETSTLRIITLDQTYREVTSLSIKQDDLFRQALRCIETECYRAAHVMAWAAFVDFIHEKLGEDGYEKLKAARPKWKVTGAQDLRQESDYQVLEAVEAIGLCKKTERKALHGLLNKRNECAHPEDYYPRLNESLGYVSELLERLKTLSERRL